MSLLLSRVFSMRVVSRNQNAVIARASATKQSMGKRFNL
jgi:hypothetical protein